MNDMTDNGVVTVLLRIEAHLERISAELQDLNTKIGGEPPEWGGLLAEFEDTADRTEKQLVEIADRLYDTVGALGALGEIKTAVERLARED
jgi:hypothetical protein